MAKDTYDKQVQKEAEDQERYAQLRESLEKATVSPEVDAERKRKKKVRLVIQNTSTHVDVSQRRSLATGGKEGARKEDARNQEADDH
jgi:hypothetical protein